MFPARLLARLLLLPSASGVALLIVLAPWSAHGASPIVVNSNADEDVADANCTLREAIIAANTNVDPYDGCTGAGGSPDAINFSLGVGTPSINTLSALPVVSDPVVIDGQTGGASRVILHGQGGLDNNYNGLKIASTAPGTTISNLVINGFPGWGIWVDAPNVTIVGNRVGTNAAGTGAMANNGGIYGAPSNASGIQIGDATGTTPGASCSGHCNLISGNAGDGIRLAVQVNNAVIQSNFVGVNVVGNLALPNTVKGVFVAGSGAQIGGPNAGEGNVISGNGDEGLWVNGPSAQIEGNFIGTNSSADAAIGNANTGFQLINADGTVVGPNNVVSGNGGDGMDMKHSSNVQIVGNLIGTAADGVTPIPNSFPGIDIVDSSSNTIGGIGPGQGNVIAFNGSGVRIADETAPTTGNTIRGNSIHDSAKLGIFLDSGNNQLAPPTITGAGPVTGTACANCIVDMYSDAADEGAIYHGFATANGSGNWTYAGVITGPNITATATDADGNTSQFSAPFPAGGATPTPTPIPTLSPTPTPIATFEHHTPTPTPTPTPSTTQWAERIQGDADCDGDADIDDVSVLLANAVGARGGEQCEIVRPPEHVYRRDVDCDSSITVLDALDVLLHLAGLQELPLPTGCSAVGQPV